MELKYIISEIDELICKALQDYLSLAVTENWQQKLFSIAEDAVLNNNFKSKYIAVYNTLVDMDDKSKFETKDMDVTLIVSVVYYRTDFVTISEETRKAVYSLSKDRNQSGHSNKNETPDELFERGIMALKNLEDFVQSVSINESSISKDKRSNYRNKYKDSIKACRDTLREERDKLSSKRKILKDVQKLLDSNDPCLAWSTISQPYFRNRKLPRGEEEFSTFITEAIRAGIIQAYPSAAEYYYMAKDYDKAEKYLLYLYQNRKDKNYNKESMLLLANIYLNKLSRHLGDDREIVEMLISDGHKVSKSDDGKYVFVYLNNQNLVADAFSKHKYKTEEAIRLLNESSSDSTKTESRNDINTESDSPKSKPDEKADQTVGGVSGSKKYRLGRIHKKKIEDDNSIPVKDVKAKSIITEPQKNHCSKTDSSNTSQISKAALTVGGISGSKKKRLGRPHKKKTDSSQESLE